MIAGTGKTLWDDLEPFRAPARTPAGLRPNWDLMTINVATVIIPLKIQHVYSNHAESIQAWIDGRCARWKRQCKPIGHTGNRNHRGNVFWGTPMQGTSALNACIVGHLMGYQRIVLCGVPLDDEGHVYDPPWNKTSFTKEVPDRGDALRFWDMAKALGNVSSMSGRTKQYLGGFDFKW